MLALDRIDKCIEMLPANSTSTTRSRRKRLILYSTSIYSVKQTRFRRPELASASSSFRYHCCLRSNSQRVLVNVYCPLQGWRPSSDSRLAILWHRQTRWRGLLRGLGEIPGKPQSLPVFLKASLPHVRRGSGLALTVKSFEKILTCSNCFIPTTLRPRKPFENWSRRTRSSLGRRR